MVKAAVKRLANVKTGAWRELRKNKIKFIMLLPAVAFFVIFSYIPMAGIGVAFRNFRFDLGIFRSPWVGFANFRFFFGSGRAFRLTMMTVGYNLAFIFTGILFAVLLAVILSELKNKLFKKVTHSIIFLPYFISWVVVAFMAYNLFSLRFGVINTTLGNWGRDPVNFYGSPAIWRVLMVVFSNWKGIGFSSIIYLAVLTGISPEYYEAARMDGASIWQRIRYISLPFLKGTVIILTLMALGSAFRGGGDMFYQLIGFNPILTPHVDVLDAFILRSMTNPLGSINFGNVAAVGLFQQTASFILVVTANGIARKVSRDNALF